MKTLIHSILHTVFAIIIINCFVNNSILRSQNDSLHNTIQTQKAYITDISAKNSHVDGIIKSMMVPVTVTAYTSSRSETDGNPFETASLKKTKKGMIAVSRDIENQYNLKFGDMIYLVLNNVIRGPYEYQDRIDHRWSKRVDIYMKNKHDAIDFGKQKGGFVIKKASFNVLSSS